MIEAGYGDDELMAQARPLSAGEKPQSTYTPLTEAEIEEFRLYFTTMRLNTRVSEETLKRANTLCDMAINMLLYGQEIDRLRGQRAEGRERGWTDGDFLDQALQNATGSILSEYAANLIRSRAKELREKRSGGPEQRSEGKA